jgi:enterochelin esterase-like enzyme
LFEQYILKDVIPTIESGYRVAANADSCAIAGLSTGGEWALTIGLGHPKLFSSIGPPGPSMLRELADRWASALAEPKATNARWKVLCIECGRQNPGHLSASRKEHETLEQAAIKHTYSETEGAHNYTLWQQHMVQLTPLLFR